MPIPCQWGPVACQHSSMPTQTATEIGLGMNPLTVLVLSLTVGHGSLSAEQNALANVLNCMDRANACAVNKVSIHRCSDR